jgi:hypothetical protein
MITRPKFTEKDHHNETHLLPTHLHPKEVYHIGIHGQVISTISLGSIYLRNLIENPSNSQSTFWVA